MGSLNNANNKDFYVDDILIEASTYDRTIIISEFYAQSNFNSDS